MYSQAKKYYRAKKYSRVKKFSRSNKYYWLKSNLITRIQNKTSSIFYIYIKLKSYVRYIR